MAGSSKTPPHVRFGQVIGKQYAPFTQLPPMPGLGGGQFLNAH